MIVSQLVRQTRLSRAQEDKRFRASSRRVILKLVAVQIASGDLPVCHGGAILALPTGRRVRFDQFVDTELTE